MDTIKILFTAMSNLLFPVLVITPVLAEVHKKEDSRDEEYDSEDGPSRATLTHTPCPRLVLVYGTLYRLGFVTHLDLLSYLQ